MKKIILLAVAMLLTYQLSHAQSTPAAIAIGSSYIANVATDVYPYQSGRKPKVDSSIHFKLNIGTKFKVVDVKSTSGAIVGYIITPWTFKKDIKKINYFTTIKQRYLIPMIGNSLGNHEQANGTLIDTSAYKLTKEEIDDVPDTPANALSPAAAYDKLAFLDYWSNSWTFFVPATTFASNSSMVYPKSFSFTWGFLTLPIKMRFDNSKGRFDFEQNLNFGLTFGIKQQVTSKQDVSFNYLAGLSIVNVPLKDSTSTTAVSLSGGCMFQYSKFQIGAFIGWDFAGAKASQFNYQGKPWIGFAIGLSLFGEEKTSAGTPSQSSD